jgi:hypothetical protein
MVYKFQSPATGDLLMLGPQGDQLLRLLGREPAARGIVEPDAMPAAIAALEAAVAADEARRAAAGDDRSGSGADDEAAGGDRVTLRQRVWPFVEMLRRAHAAGKPVVWGV